jgi:hypothetical protein
VSDAVKRITEALVDLSEDEAAAILADLGVRGARESKRSAAPRTPLPAPREGSGIHSEIEWV